MWCKITFVVLFVLFSLTVAQYALPTGDPASSWANQAVLIPWSQQCMGARNTYWADNTDVKNANLDPLWHYQNSGWKDGRAWPGTACNSPPIIWANDTLCNCTTAQSIFMGKYHVSGLTNNASAFSYWTTWMEYYGSGGKVWHCDLCMEELGLESSSGDILPADCQCWQAREKYWNENKDVYLANLDPVSHYFSSGYKEGRLWHCELCNGSVTDVGTPIDAYNASCGCAAAATRFNNDFPTVGTNVNTAYPKWVSFNKAGDSEAWHCELCSDLLNAIFNGTLVGAPTIPPYRLPFSCDCVQAEDAYFNAHPDVLAARSDPIWKYETTGHSLGQSWDCDACNVADVVYINDTLCNCSEAIADYLHAYPAGFHPYDSGTAFEYWLTTDRPQTGHYWNCTLCIDALAEIKKIRAYNPQVSGGLGAIVGAAALIGLFAAIMLAMFWGAFSKHGSFYSAVIVMGVAISYVAALTQLPRPTDALCTAFPWLLGTAFILVYGCLFIKTWALYKVWTDASNFKRSNLTPTTILKIIGAALIIEFAYLAVWTGVDRPKVVLSKTVNGDYQHLCKCHSIAWWAVFLAVKGAWMVFGAALSILTRNIAKDYSESKSIGYAIYNDIAILIVAIPLAILLQDIPGGIQVIEIAVIVITFTFTMCILFFDVWWGIFFPEKDMISAIKMTPNSRSRGSGSPNNSGTSTTRNSTVNVTQTQSGHSNSSHSSA